MIDPRLGEFIIGFLIGGISIIGAYHIYKYDSRGYSTAINVMYRQLKTGHNHLLIVSCNKNMVGHILKIRKKIHGCFIYKNNGQFYIVTKDLKKTFMKSRDYLKANKLSSEDIQLCIIPFKNIPDKPTLLSYKIEPGIKPGVKILGKKESIKLQEEFYLSQQIRDIVNTNDAFDSRIQIVAQPIFNTKTGKFSTSEILSRLNIENLGNIPPQTFISYIEENNLTYTYNFLVLNKACMLLNSCKAENMEIKGVSVNFNPCDIVNASFVNDLNTVTERYNIPHSMIRIEVTETTEIGNISKLHNTLITIKKAGYKIYLDDFGTGNSNLIELVKIPFDTIKIDKSILDEAKINVYAKKVLHELCALIEDGERKVLIEGIEDKKDIETLGLNNVSFIQGYAYSKPLDIISYMAFLKNQQLCEAV